MAPPVLGLKMLDLSRQLPGPFCSMLLADLGVDVLIVAAPNDPMGAGLSLVQRNKRSMTLNLKTPEGRGIFDRLAGECDIILEGFRPGVTDRLGIGYARMAGINPRVIYCAISGYGQDGPYRDKVGHDINYLGYAGVLGVSGAAGGPPLPMPVQVADLASGALMAAVAILAAVVARERTGRGQYIDISMMDGSVALNVYHILMHLAVGAQPARGGTMLTGHHPCYAVYETSDGKHVTVGALEPHFWRNLCTAFDRPDFVEHQFAEGARREEMFAFFRAAFRAQPQAYWLEKLGAIDICFGPVTDVGEVLDDPHVRHRHLVERLRDQVLVASPLKLSDTPAVRPTAPAAFGAHTEEVLRGLGIEDARIAELRAAGIV